MKKQINFFLILFSLFIASLNINGQTLAITENGDSIFVYDNGTWSFELRDEMPQVNEFGYLSAELEIDTLHQKFVFSPNAKKEAKNRWGQFLIKYDDKKWKRIPPATLNEEAELAFQGESKDIWCVVISEETEIAPDKLLRIAKKTMEVNTGAEVKIKNVECRNVNGEDIIRGTFAANFSGLNFVFDTYYFSNELGSVQFTTWTSDKLWERNREEILELLNGFVALEFGKG